VVPGHWVRCDRIEVQEGVARPLLPL